MEFREIEHYVDFCVVGGGMAGICAAIAAARHGAAVALMHDRPVLGGNASSECRVHICGADRHNTIKNMRETGILEELRMENLYRNPNRSFSVWDTILYEKVMLEPNITMLLNCSCLQADADNGFIRSVTGWQLTTQTYHHVKARIFADCSGDAILAPLTGAQYRTGREGRDEYGESIAPASADSRTMGMTCLFQARQYRSPQPFEPPAWAHRYESCDELPYGVGGHRWLEMGYWWVELGGEHDSIHDTEHLRDQLLKTVYGVWDHIKNYCPNRHEAENWALDWVQFLPAKRESRRYIGEHVLTQNDIESGGRFEDVVAYGGWTMDDHHPAGFNCVKVNAPATIFHEAPSPYGIPLRCLHSRNIENLMFAGRDASCTHAAMSSTRVMGTGCTMGQAVGTAAALALSKGIVPADLRDHIPELQQLLIRDDAYLPGVRQHFSDHVSRAKLRASHGQPEPVRDGVNRPIGNDPHCWMCRRGDWIEYQFDSAIDVSQVTVILDSGLDRCVAMSYHQEDDQLTSPPPTMPKTFRIDGLVNGEWCELVHELQNHQRLRKFSLESCLSAGSRLSGIRFTLKEAWGDSVSRVYAFYVD